MPIELQGMSQLMRQIEQMGRRIESGVKDKALKEGAEFIQEEIIVNAPERTGKLKENIVVSDVEGDQIHVGPDQQGTAFYGHFLEFGTSKMSAQPFMAPTLENNKDAVQEKMADVIKRELGL
jgi:HK97 gp10 family phage protein